MRLPLVLAILLAALAGCDVRTTPGGDKAKPAPKASHDDHHHAPGPHGGTIFEFGGGKWHMEFAVDHDKKEARVYVLGDDAKSPAPIKAEKLLLSLKTPRIMIDLKPERQKGDPEGKSSGFVGTHERLGRKQDFEGTVVGKISGKNYVGDFKEGEGDHGHGHPHPHPH